MPKFCKYKFDLGSFPKTVKLEKIIQHKNYNWLFSLQADEWQKLTDQIFNSKAFENSVCFGKFRGFPKGY